MDLLGTRRAKREFDAFVSSTAGPLFRSGYLMTADAAETEDLLQETFLKVAHRWHRVRSMERPGAYARRILVNLILDGAPARSRRGKELARSDDVPDVTDQGSVRVLSGIDDRSEFGWALTMLPPRQRAVLVLRYWDDLSEAETAEVLGCPVGTVKSTASRGVAELRRMLGTRPGLSPGVSPDRASTKDEERHSC